MNFHIFTVHLSSIWKSSHRTPVQLIHPSMHKYIYNRPVCVRVSESVLGGYQRQGTQQCGVGL
jgi:hypothetical protein